MRVDMPQPMEKRLLNEIEHGRYLSKRNACEIWNWETPAGKVRWARRIRMLTGGIVSSMRVLEVGCGTGYLTMELAKTGALVTAIDISTDLLAMARSNVNDPRVSFVAGNAYSTEFPDRSFDIIVGSGVLHHLEMGKALGEFYRILKDGGAIFFTEPNMMNPQIFVQKNIPYIKRMMGDSPDETAFFSWSLKGKMKRAGFKEIKITPFDFLHPGIPRRLVGIVQSICAMAERCPLLSEIAGSLYVTAKK